MKYKLKGITADNQVITGTPEGLDSWAKTASEDGAVFILRKDDLEVYLELYDDTGLDPANWLDDRYVKPSLVVTAEADNAESAAALAKAIKPSYHVTPEGNDPSVRVIIPDGIHQSENWEEIEGST